MVNFLIQLFVLLPLSALATVAGVAAIYGAYFLAVYGMDGVVSLEFFEINRAIGGTEALVLLLGGLVLTLTLWFIDIKLRRIRGAGWLIFDLIIAPVRVCLQLCALQMAFFGIFFKSTVSSKNFPDKNFSANLSSVLFNMYNIKKVKEKPAKKDKSKERQVGGEGGLKAKNVAYNLLVLLPFTAVQCFFVVLLFSMVGGSPIIPLPQGGNGDSKSEMLTLAIVVICVFAILFLAMIYVQIRGHEPTSQYWDKYFEHKKDGVTVESEHGYDPEIDDYEVKDGTTGEKWKKKRGGWTDYINLKTVITIILSPVLVAFELVAVVIAMFTNPDKGRIFSWYGDIDWRICNDSPVQKILHYLFGFVILSE